MLEPFSIAAIAATFLLAGIVKGVIGLGLPTVCLGLMTAVFDLPTAMACLLVPSFATNLWQGVAGGNGVAILKRLWPFLVMATVTVWIGALAMTRLDPKILSTLLGCLIVFHAGLGLTGFRLSISPGREVWTGPLFGAANGILTGMTGSFVVPGVMFLQAIGLNKDILVQAMGMLFTVSTIALALALHNNQLLTNELGAASALGLIPAILGMVLGQKVRGRLSEERFRQVFFISLLALGGYIIAGALKIL
ncbi:MAG: sulfite exporter TauE/SafE family protein [Rhodospirillaceae bacterium]